MNVFFYSKIQSVNRILVTLIGHGNIKDKYFADIKQFIDKKRKSDNSIPIRSGTRPSEPRSKLPLGWRRVISELS